MRYRSNEPFNDLPLLPLGLLDIPALYLSRYIIHTKRSIAAACAA